MRRATEQRFRDRREAGRRLAGALAPYAGPDVVVLGLPRGGVPVAAEVAETLGAPLDVIVVRKLGVPSQPEFGMGAIGEGGVRVLDLELVRRAGVAPGAVEGVEHRERAELERRVRRFRGDRPAVPIEGRTAIIVDDGVATGGTARAAVQVARAHGAARVVLAVPVAAPEAVRELAGVADDVIALETPEFMRAIGYWYDDFTQTSDEDVVALLSRARERTAVGSPSGRVTTAQVLDVAIPVGRVALAGRLDVPPSSRGLVVFVHGSGSSRLSPRNRSVAEHLGASGFATLLFDLLTTDEERARRNVFDIELLADRLRSVTSWLADQYEVSGIPIGYFGASTGAAAALVAAADPESPVAAVVSRGGRPDLAGQYLEAVQAPTLLIVGSDDRDVLALNQQAAARMSCTREIRVVTGATHLFEEPGTLETVARLAERWFGEHLGAGVTGAG
ncbi:MAG TPA: alpha/beta fold hydrolase [Acidimicrobiia bacterium]|nr:alpha/beta fold hydrolase [Acidimicrobiia bacterium]